MNVSKLINVLSSINAAEAIITANNGKMIIFSEAEGFKSYAEVDSEISLPQVTVEVSQLLEALKGAQGADLVLFYADSKLSLKTDKMSFSMDVIEDERVIPTIPNNEYFEVIDFEGLKTALTKVIGATAKDKMRPQLEMVNFDGHKIMATNTFIMAVYNMVQAPNILKDARFGLNSSVVKHILKIGKKERVASIYLNELSFYIKLGDTIFICRKGDPSKFDYNRILNESLQQADHNAFIVTDDLKKALKSLKPTLKQEGNRLNFSFNENKATLKAGDFNLEITAVYNSEPRQVTLNSEYIETFLKTAGAFMNIAVKNEKAPVVLTANDNSYNFVVMPMWAQ